MEFNSVLDVIEHRVAHVLRPQSLWPSLALDDAGVRLTPEQARAALYGPQRDLRARDAVWRQAVAAVRDERDAPVGTALRADGPAQTFVVWLALPSIQRTAYRVSCQLGLERQDAEAEMMAALLEAAAVEDPEQPGLGSVLLRRMCGRAWTLARQRVRETPVGDAEAVKAAADDAAADHPEDLAEDQWEVHIAPPPRPDGLSASIRFTVASAVRIEEQRRVSMARRLGLEDIVYRARRPGEGSPIGQLSLRPAGGAR